MYNYHLLKDRQAGRFTISFLLILSLFSSVGCDEGIVGDDSSFWPIETTALTIAVFSDPHLYDAALGTSGPDFEAYLAQDPKLLRESDAILRTVINEIKASRADVVLVPGDLSKDGELACHNKMAPYLAELEAAGKQVFVIPGNHDVNNLYDARSYSNAGSSSVPTVTPDQFKSIYNSYGYSQAIASDPQSLSYTVKLTDNLWLIAMDASRYNENTAAGASVIGGKFSAATLDWIKGQLHLAKQQGITVIGMMHHGLMEHFAGQTQIFGEYVIEDWQTLIKTFADSGMKAIFTGHYHSNDVVKGGGSTAGKFIYDIETGSTISYPCPYRIVTIGKKNNAFSTLSIQTKKVTSVTGDFGGKTFAKYAEDTLRVGVNRIVTYMMINQYGLSEQDAVLPSQLMTDALIANYAGNETPSAQTLSAISAILQNPDAAYQTIGNLLMSLWTDIPPADNNLTINLKTGAVN
jgi:hypothetical protein